MNDIMGVDREGASAEERDGGKKGGRLAGRSASSLWIFVLCTSSTSTITNDTIPPRLSHIVNIVVNTCEREGATAVERERESVGESNWRNRNLQQLDQVSTRYING